MRQDECGAGRIFASVHAVPSFLEGGRVMMSHVKALPLPIATSPAKPIESHQGVSQRAEPLELMNNAAKESAR